ncbi:hypothetical protein JY651_17440 [Pyxidicoccus parkwayensis]|uniref:Tetratricopeptide repeat protein n=1 Tax=Pyxidicoccus parkwayensis TaxID=2813578 RepID=A0ABX7P7W6_9BACT|nr:hypothetical protein [Pyxidicoccus parkwaysis]QSQ26604.1 hypothetical protein JY651_17440 [Pyxidicoccus parkwaysis]
MWLAVTLLVVLGQAEPANPYLEQARARYEALHFSEAVDLLELAEQVPSSTHAQHLDILELRARCELAEGRRQEAEATYERMLMLDPRTEPPADLSPKILETFQAVKARLFPAGYVALKQLPAAEGLVRMAVVDPWRRVDAVVLHWRGSRDVDWRPLRARPDAECCVFQLPGGGPGPVRWYAEAQGPDGNGLTRLGAPEAPLEWTRSMASMSPPGTKARDGVVAESLVAPASPPGAERGDVHGDREDSTTPRLRRTLGWVSLGVAVAAGLGGTWLQVQSAESHDTALRAEWAGDSRRHSARARTQAGWATGLFIGGGAAALGGGYLLTW